MKKQYIILLILVIAAIFGIKNNVLACKSAMGGIQYVINGVSPNIASPGDTITITGSGFGASARYSGGWSGILLCQMSTGYCTVIASGEGPSNPYYSNILSWSNTQIQVKIPTDILIGYPYLNSLLRVRVDGDVGEICAAPPTYTSDRIMFAQYCNADQWQCEGWGTCSLYGNQTRVCNRIIDCPDVDTPSPITSQNCTPECTSDTWSCGSWAACMANGTQTRACIKIFDCSLTDTPSPATTQSCIYIPPVCTSFTYSNWSACQSNGIKTRSVISSSPIGCSGGSPTLTEACTYVAPTCTSWTYSDWNTCSASGQQTRTIISSSPDSCTGGSPATSQSCTPAPVACTSWSYSDWGTCSANGQQTRTVSSSLPSGCAGGSPVITQSCTYNGPTISSISPSTIYNGTYVTVNGSKFISSSAYSCYNCEVLINDVKVSGISSYSWYADKVYFSIPNDAISGYVQIKNYNGLLSDKFNITVSPDPSKIPSVITSISPQAITPGDTISINGSGFGISKGSSDLTIGGGTYYSGKILSWTDTEIKYQTSISSDNYSKKIGIKKCKSSYNCQPVVYGGYFYIQPKINSLSFYEGAVGMKLSVYGSYLKDSNVDSDAAKKYSVIVYFNGVKATYPSTGTWTSGQIDVSVPDGATSGNVSLEIVADTGEKVVATGPYFKIAQAISRDTYSGLQDYLKQINLPSAWGLANTSRIITVAVLDQGIYSNHPDLQDHLWVNDKETVNNGRDDDNNGYVDDKWGWNFVTNTKDVSPAGGHGTAVAGIIGAIRDNNIGIAGVNQNVKLMPLVVIGSDGSGSADSINRAIRYAVDNGAEIINLSLGTHYLTAYTPEHDSAIKYAYDHNVLIVAAAGNGDIPLGNGFNLNISPQSPVCNDGGLNMVIGVAAVTDDNNFRPNWSNYGSKCVDIWAPGVDILSTTLPTLTIFDEITSIDGAGYYSKADGTSFAAPIVTGVVSLLKATYPKITSQEVIKLLVDNANNGVVDAFKTLNANYTPPNIQTVQNSSGNQQTTTSNGSTNSTGAGSIIDPTNLDRLLSSLGSARNVPDEVKYRALVELDAREYKVQQSSQQKIAVTNFVTYGMSVSTLLLGAGERRALVRDYFETVGRGDIYWPDLENLTNGQKVIARNLTKENAQVTVVLKIFKKIFGHTPKFSDTKEDLAWNTMMYRIRFPRDLNREKAGIDKFLKIFYYLPKTPLDWATVRVLGYVVN